MYLGIDVGGTHTDAAVVQDGRVVAKIKTVTQKDDLFVSFNAALAAVLSVVDPAAITRVNVSTTLTTNAIVEGKTEPVGVFVSAGPGVDPEEHRIGGHYAVIPGALDHRGFELDPLDEAYAAKIADQWREQGLCAFACVGKFSTRNPNHENLLAKAAGKIACNHFTTLGHRLSGRLNFPRRIATAYYNSAVQGLYDQFAVSAEKALAARGLACPVNILKADGGTTPLPLSRLRPVESILSGPAASVMGVLALSPAKEDAVILDIGGTTTDLALFVDGAPLIENEGVVVGSYPTLVRALKTRSIGVGGDSRLSVVEGRVHVGPEREGPAAAFGGNKPTLMDCLNFLGLADAGDKKASDRAVAAFAALWDLIPQQTAQAAVDNAAEQIKNAFDDMLLELNQKPVYTIMELLSGREIKPRKAYVVGGPAGVMAPILAHTLAIDVQAPKDFDVANAIGAALTRTTAELELFADTQRKEIHIPILGTARPTPKNYDLEQAVQDAAQSLKAHLAAQGEEGVVQVVQGGPDLIDVVEAQNFAMIGDSGEQFRNIRVKVQIRPGLTASLKP